MHVSAVNFAYGGAPQIRYMYTCSMSTYSKFFLALRNVPVSGKCDQTRLSMLQTASSAHSTYRISANLSHTFLHHASRARKGVRLSIECDFLLNVLKQYGSDLKNGLRLVLGEIR